MGRTVELDDELLKLDNWLVDSQRITDSGQDLGDRSIAFRAKDILHLHGFHDSQILTDSDFMPFLDKQLPQHARHGRE
jgi:hypothetical protein